MSAAESVALRRVTWRLLPFLLVTYIICWLDRVNVGFAALQMNQDLGFSATVYGFGAGVFFAGYALFEIPSNLILARVGARRWIARIMITWGLISACMMFVFDSRSFYVLRFLLGVAEAGFLPGIIYYLGNWYPGPQRARAVGWFMSAIPLSIVIGGPLAGMLLSMDGLMGLRGWQWLYLVEGAPAFFLGFVVLAVLPDKPSDVRWLSESERDLLSARIRAEQEQARAQHGLGLGRAMLHPTVWALALIMFTCQSGSYGLTLWMPQILKGLSGLSDLLVGMISALPYVAAAIGMVLIGASSDRSGERFLHIAIPSLVAVIGFVASAWITSPLPALVALTVAAVGDLGSRGPFWALPGRFLAGSAAAGAIALINTVGSLGGFVGPYAVGLVKDATGNFTGGLMFLALLLLLGAFGTLRLRDAAVLRAGPH
ncbi:MAG: MFS transporter [Gammaproteobacteria bacterium]|nr:MFS transporter [Gammaproteobacteria bacterium]